MKIAHLLLHDFRFAEWGIRELLEKHHFAMEYAYRLSQENEVVLYVFHQDVKAKIDVDMGRYMIKILPVTLRIPPLLEFGNDHSMCLLGELQRDAPDLIHFNNYYLWAFPYVVFWAVKKRIPVIAQYHGACDLLRPLRRAFSWSYRNVSSYLVALDEEAEYLRREIGVDGRRIIKFPNTGVDTRLFRPTRPKAHSPTLAYVGRMTRPSRNLREQSPWLLLLIISRLAGECKNLKLKMVGDGPGLGFLKALAREKGLGDCVEFLGYVSHDKLPDIYSECWATFFPIEMEAVNPFWGGAQKESLACSTPTIAFLKSGAAPQTSEGSCGYLIPQSPELGAESMRKILLQKEELFRKGEVGRGLMEKYCAWDAVIKNLGEIYSDLVSRARHEKKRGGR